MTLCLPSQIVFGNTPSRCCFCFATSVSSCKSHNLSVRSITFPPRFRISHRRQHTIHVTFKFGFRSLQAHESDGAASTSSPIIDNFRDFDFDSFLSFAEVVCIASSAVASFCFAANFSVLGLKNEVLGEMGRKLLLCGVAGLVGGLAIGAWIRRRQRRRISGSSARVQGLTLLKRIEKLEEESRNSATVVRVLSRHLEKLEIRIRGTKNALKQPITEAAVLTQGTSEATRALAVQEGILEKEIRETQTVLLAMQEQQQKQLNLILAIVKNSGLDVAKERSRETLNRTRDYNSSDEVRHTEKQNAQPVDAISKKGAEIVSDSATSKSKPV